MATGAVVAFISPAYAQAQAASDSANNNQDEIIVTAQKREQRLLDVPQSVSVLSAQALTAVHAERFADYFTRIPSASFVEDQAGQTRLILRGINTGGVGATVATYVDETPYGSATALANGAILTPDIDPFDLQRVEVLRGPQGTLYGANSLGGLVKYVTIAPQTDAVHYAAEGGVENVDHGSTGWSGRAAVNLPLGSAAAIRASGFYRHDPGYIDDARFGSDVNDGKTYGGRISGLVRPTDDLTIRGTAVFQNLYSNGTNTIDVDAVTLRPVLGKYEHSRTVAEPNNMKYRIYNGTVDYDFGPVNLVASSSWGTLDQAQVQDPSGLYGPLLTGIFGQPLGASLDQNVTQRRFTEEVRLTSSGKNKLEWTLGAFYTRERNLIDQALNAVDAGTGAEVAALSPLALATVGSRYREYAGFGNVTYHFSRQFDLTVGGRYSHNRQTTLQETSGPLAGDSSITGVSSDNVFTYSIAPAFKPNDHTTFYLRVARGYRPGGPNALPPLSPDSVPRQFGADTTTNYEAGVKAELIDRLLTVELTGFYIDWKDIQLFTSVDGFGVNTNGGKARSKGIEFTSTLTPTRGLTLSANGSYVDARLTEDASPLVGGLDGDRLPYNPRFSGTLSADYSRPLSGTIEGTFGVSWRYTGERRSAFDAGLGQYKLGAFSQIDAHAGVTFDRFRIDAFARNLTDSRGITNLGTSGTAPNGALAAAIIRPRSYGLTIGVRY
ncbi:TonB-dependent receptor [Sphingomonas crusticola]|uniref:TonB-dependent receptor n=1 Tax=Sphingomonas crusticola TaxID=1697973 RepID=UPI0013C30ED0|nr:TonB-dependent receptor [Sphingomonas crusticola]